MSVDRADPEPEASTRARWLLVGGASLAALAWDPRAPAVDAKRSVLLVVALATGAWLLLARGADSPARWPRAWSASIAFVVLSAASVAWGKPAGWLDVGVWVGALGVASFAARLGPARAIEASGAAATAIGAVTALHLVGARLAGARGLALHGLQGNPNWAGLVLAVALPLTLDVALSRRRRRARGWTWIAAAVMLEGVGLALSHARVGWIAAACALPLVVAPHLRSWSPRRGSRLVAALVALGLGVVGAALVAERAHPRADDYEAPADVAVHGRLWIARASLRAAWRAAPLGTGVGGFAHGFLDAQGELLGELPPRPAARAFVNATTAHDDWLQAAVETGPLGLALLLAALGATALAHRRRWPAGCASIVAVAIGALADSPLRQPAVVVLVALVIAAVPVRDRERAAPSPRPIRALELALPAVMLLAGTWLLGRSVRAELGVRLRTEALDRDPAARRALLARSVRVDPSCGDGLLDLGLARLDDGDVDGAIVALRASRTLLANVGTDIALGIAHRRTGQLDEAADDDRAALARDPGSFKAHADLADVLLAMGRLDEAEAHAAIALSLRPGSDPVRALVDRIAAARIDATIDEAGPFTE